VTLVEISQDEQSGWQRRAAAELAAILQQYRDLPAITWTVGPAGCVLLGRVTGPACAAERRAVFAAWRAALALEEHAEPVRAAGTAHLHATARRNRARVRLTATVLDAEGEKA
jgi:hypothetical protein